MHRTLNFLPHIATTELARRRFLVLGMNSRFDNNDTAMHNGTSTLPDDDMMVIARAEGARLMDPEPTIHHGTSKPQKFLRDNGTIATRIVDSILPPVRVSEAANATFDAARMMTVTSFLSATAIRSTNSMDGVDWWSSNTSTPCALGSISVPVLSLRQLDWKFMAALAPTTAPDYTTRTRHAKTGVYPMHHNMTREM